jgi:capsular exopolysaccharide synthesis family protein
MAFAALAGLFFPFALAILWEHLIRRIGSPQNLDQDARLTVVGEIASMPVSTRKALSARRERERRVFEESVDGLATNLMLSDEFRDIRVLAVTSAVKHEGKTSLTVTLARSFARILTEPVLVIDADTRSPDIHDIFGTPLEPGFVDILEDRCPLKDAIVANETDTVHVIPAGRLASGPHSLVAKGRLERLLKEVSGSYRYVIIDTPPVLSASESLAFAKAADACVVCAMRNVSRLDRVKRAVQRLEGVGARTIGTVFSGVPTKRYAQRYDTYEYASE